MSCKGESALHRAAREGRLEDLKKLVNAENVNQTNENNLQTPLFCACVAGHADVVQFLLDAGAKFTSARMCTWSQTDGNTVEPTDGATVEPSVEERSEEVSRDDLSDVMLMDDDDDDDDFVPVLVAACSAGHTAVVKILLEKGAPLNESVWTPLHAACIRREENFDIDLVRLLISYGADVNARDAEGRTPLLILASNMFSSGGELEAVKLLIEAGAAVNEEGGYHMADERGSDSDSDSDFEMGDDGETPLHAAVSNSSIDLTRLLLEHGADVNALNRKRQTPLQVQYYLPPPFIIRLLLDYNAGDAKCCEKGHRCGLSVLLCCYNKLVYFQKHPVVRINSMFGYGNLQFNNLNGDVDIKLSMIEMHGSKMRVAGLMPFDDDAETNAETNEFHEKCKAELEKMKTETAGDTNVTYENIWNQRPAALQKVESLEIREIQPVFPIYCELIRRRYVSGRLRLPFLVKAKEFFHSLPLPNLLPESIDEILSFLSTSDLKNLVSIVKTATEISNKTAIAD